MNKVVRINDFQSETGLSSKKLVKLTLLNILNNDIQDIEINVIHTNNITEIKVCDLNKNNIKTEGTRDNNKVNSRQENNVNKENVNQLKDRDSVNSHINNVEIIKDVNISNNVATHTNNTKESETFSFTFEEFKRMYPNKDEKEMKKAEHIFESYLKNYNDEERTNILLHQIKAGLERYNEYVKHYHVQPHVITSPFKWLYLEYWKNKYDLNDPLEGMVSNFMNKQVNTANVSEQELKENEEYIKKTILKENIKETHPMQPEQTIIEKNEPKLPFTFEEFRDNYPRTNTNEEIEKARELFNEILTRFSNTQARDKFLDYLKESLKIYCNFRRMYNVGDKDIVSPYQYLYSKSYDIEAKTATFNKLPFNKR